MHTYEIDGVLFHYNSDMSGNVLIVNKNSKEELEVNGEAILSFIANYIRDRKVSRLDNMTTKEILEEII